MSSEADIFVYVDMDGKSLFVGRLWFRIRKGRESATFEYDRAWIDNPDNFSLEPALAVGVGPYHTPPDKALFGAIGDSAPDRWGRMLMRRAEAHRAKNEGRTPRSLSEIDYLLQVNDEVRQGAIRFASQLGGAFLTPSGPTSIPPLLDLPRLLSASDKVTKDEASSEEIRLLLAPGSSLGGARPKASVRDRNGSLAIVKFPDPSDEVDTVRWEAVALTLAKKSGIRVPDWRIEMIGVRPVLLLRRFDRAGSFRIPFLSAMSMLGASDNEPRSYLEIADALRWYGAQIKEDLRELWRRIVFNVLISNTDDHLRNHGFLNERSKGWRLSPAYDMNPVPLDIKPRILSTAITLDDPSASLTLAMEMGGYFDLDKNEMREIARAIGRIVSNWRKAASKLGLSVKEIERMETAFEHEDLSASLK